VSNELTVINPMMLLDKALDKGLQVEQLGKLIDMAEAWRRSRAQEAWQRAMTRVQAEVPVILKDADNQQTQSRYARLDTINKKIVPVYTTHGFSLSFSEDDSPRGASWTRIVCDVGHEDGHCVKKFIDMPPEGEGIKGRRMMTATHAKGSSTTYGRRYLTCLIFNVTVSDEDDDGNAAGGHGEPAREDRPEPATEEERILGGVEDWLRTVPNREAVNAKMREKIATMPQGALKAEILRRVDHFATGQGWKMESGQYVVAPQDDTPGAIKSIKKWLAEENPGPVALNNTLTDLQKETEPVRMAGVALIREYANANGMQWLSDGYHYPEERKLATQE
jgi:hypothetical protein